MLDTLAVQTTDELVPQILVQLITELAVLAQPSELRDILYHIAANRLVGLPISLVEFESLRNYIRHWLKVVLEQVN